MSQYVFVFLIATYLGVKLIIKVPSTLHTPLMSGSNALSGVTVLGSMVVAASLESPFRHFLGFIAVTLGMANVVGGFLVTDRMLKFFVKKPSA